MFLEYIIVYIILVFTGFSQYYFGCKNYKKLGLIFPILFIGVVILFSIDGSMEFSLRDISIPLLALFMLAFIWNLGYKKTRIRKQSNK